jgi:hypothetical protein
MITEEVNVDAKEEAKDEVKQVSISLEDRDMTERFLSFVDYTRLADIEFARGIGVSKQTMSNVRNYRGPVSGATIVLACRKYKDLNANWIIHGVGEMLVKDNPPPNLMEAELRLAKQRLEHALNVIDAYKSKLVKFGKME